MEIVPAHNPPDTVQGDDTAHAATDTEENVVVDGAGDDQLHLSLQHRVQSKVRTLIHHREMVALTLRMIQNTHSLI